MNYVELWIGAYMKDTQGLKLVDHGAYLRLLLLCFAIETGISADPKQVCKDLGITRVSERKAVAKILHIYFPIGEDGLRHNSRADKEIAKFQRRAAIAKANGKKGGRPNPAGSDKNNPAGKNQITQLVDHSPQSTTNHRSTRSLSTEKAAAAVNAKPIAAASGEKSKPPKTRAGEIAALIIALEEARPAKPVKGIAGSTEVKFWQNDGVTDDQVREAHRQASERRIQAGEATAPIPMKFLALFIAQIRKAAEDARPREWFETAPGIEAKGEEIGVGRYEIDQYPGGFPEYKAVVLERAGL